MERIDETQSLISAEKVSGTEVYNPSGETLGEVRDVMLDKRSGRVAYAIMAFGGFVGIGRNYFPLPWSTLRYDTRKEGYVVDLSKDLLKAAPSYAAEKMPTWDRGYESQIHDYYKVPPYWL